MPEIALHTRLHADQVAEYERVHAAVPADLMAALRSAGVRDWRIWRDGTDLFHLVDVIDYHAMRDYLREHPANVAWQARVGPLHATPDDYSGGDDGIRLLWSFAGQLAAPELNRDSA
jgi:L-rhamnose mutarotase